MISLLKGLPKFVLITLLQKINQKRFKFYKDCGELPVRIFFDIMDKQELRLLLKCNRLPVYDVSKLLPVWENILHEYEKLTDSFGYTNSLKKISFDAIKTNRLNGLIACYYLLKYNMPESEEALQYWKISNISTDALKTKILQEKTKLNIEAIRKRKDVKQDFDFETMVMDVENSLERNLDINTMTVKRWVAACKSIEKKVKYYENLKNGR
jgi:hypothetical protein